MAKRKKQERKKVLVIDDETDLRQFSSWLLEAEGYLVLQAADGETGLETARQEHPDLILLDIRLPGLYGWEILKQVKTSPQLSDIPVVIFTASADLVFKDKGMEMGALDYLVKPVSAAQLKECVQRILRSDPMEVN